MKAGAGWGNTPADEPGPVAPFITLCRPPDWLLAPGPEPPSRPPPPPPGSRDDMDELLVELWWWWLLLTPLPPLLPL